MQNTDRACIVIILIRAPSGEYFVHQRHLGKAQFPGRFGLGAGGSIEPGETPLDAARRELWEETGLKAAATEPVHPLFQLNYDSPAARHRLHVFEHSTRAEPRHDSREWQWSGWLTEGQVSKLALQGKLCPDTNLAFERYVRDRAQASSATSVASGKF